MQVAGDGPHSSSASAGPDMPSDEDASAEAARSQDFRRFTVTLGNSRLIGTSGSSKHVTSTSMARPRPAPHSITVSPSRSVAIPARRNLQIASTTIVSAIAVSVAKTNAVVFCQ